MVVACKGNRPVTCLVMKKVRIYFSSSLRGQATGRLPCHLRSLALVYVWSLVLVYVWSLVLVYVWSLVLVYVWSLVLVYVWSLVLVYVWSLVDPPALPLVHYGKREVLAVISSMEGDYNAILDWRSSTGSVPPGATTQWGSSIIIAREAKRIHGSKRKSFMADMYGFANDGELQAIKAYLLSHGNFEIKQVTLQGGGVYYLSI